MEKLRLEPAEERRAEKKASSNLSTHLWLTQPAERHSHNPRRRDDDAQLDQYQQQHIFNTRLRGYAHVRNLRPRCSRRQCTKALFVHLARG
jgi:hypothetical protein